MMENPDRKIISSISSDLLIASGLTIASVFSTYILGLSMVIFSSLSPVILSSYVYLEASKMEFAGVTSTVTLLFRQEAFFFS